jgi:hypothetical protein
LVGFTGSIPYALDEQVNVDRVRAFGTWVWMVYRRDAAEWRRRRRHGLGAVAQLDVLDVLMDLPAGMAVPLRSLQASERRLLRRTPVGAVLHRTGAVIRQLVPAVTPLLAIVPAREWQSGAEAASRFAVYCPRMVVLSKSPKDMDAIVSEASWYGIGVAIGRSEGSEIVFEPEPLADWQPTPAGWAFSEILYGQLDQPTVGDPRAPL